MQIRPAAIDDLDALARMRHALWPDGSVEEHRRDAEAFLRGEPVSTMPLAVFVADDGDRLLGFVEVGLRSHADGCDALHPVGYLEGWWVDPVSRRHGIGRALVAEAEAWAMALGCVEMASDTWQSQTVSRHAHAALGYDVVDECVHYRKSLK